MRYLVWEPIPGESTLRELRAREPRPWRECAFARTRRGFVCCLTREHAAPSTPRRIARSAQDAEIVERVRSASTHGEDVIDRQVISTDTPQAPGLPLDEPTTDTEVLLGIAALLWGARARHDSDCFPVSVDERRLAPRFGQARFQRHHFHSPSIGATLKSGLRPRLGGCVSGPRTTAAACAVSPLPGTQPWSPPCSAENRPTGLWTTVRK